MVWSRIMSFFFFNDTATTEIYTLSLHDALPILLGVQHQPSAPAPTMPVQPSPKAAPKPAAQPPVQRPQAPMQGLRSEEHTSELQSRQYLVCRLLLEKKKEPRHRERQRLVDYLHP